MKSLLMVVVALIVTACASGSAIVIGAPRAAIPDWATVQLLAERPAAAETVGMVKASSDAGMTSQESVNYAIEELKKQAAKIGANAVVIANSRTDKSLMGIPGYQYSGTGPSGTYIIPYETEVIEGTAIFVPPGND